MFDQQDIDELNAGIAGWDRKNVDEIRAEMDALGIKHYDYSKNKTPLRQAFKSRLRQKFGLTDRISYTMPRSAVFVHKGVSRGHGKNNPRKAKEFFNPVVDRNLDELANIVADGQGNLVINSINIR